VGPDVTLETATWEASHQGRRTVHLRCVRLEVVSGPDTGAGQQFSQPVVRVGSHRSCDLVLTDRRVSRFQCEISLEERGYRVRDLGSTNGTFVAGLRIADAFVPPGSKIKVGQSELFLVPLGTSVAVELEEMERFHGLVGGSVPMRRLYTAIQKLAPTDSTVLITGETGVGKTALARAMHGWSARSGGPFIPVHLGDLTPTLIESELFGHERGAFTGASAGRAGRFETAQGGTIFLDEVSETPLPIQAKLLRVIQDRSFERVGGGKTVQADVRIIAATSRDLRAAIARGEFREDLFYRLNVVPLSVPPLRERPDDLELLVEAILAGIHAVDRNPRRIAAEAWTRLRAHGWPGNIRELESVLRRAAILEEGPELLLEGFPDPSAGAAGPAAPGDEDGWPSLEEHERRYVARVLQQCGGVIEGPAGAAHLLGLRPSTLRSLMKRLDVSAQPARDKARRSPP
jgi:DNA-binding NtrC family response regulator